MNSTRAPGTNPASPPMPPGATGTALNHAASSSRSNSYPQMTFNAMFNSPARLSQPHLHPDKLNGALWFGIDPCVHAFIRATWQGYYQGPWNSWRKVPEERKDSWWQTFVQNFFWESQFNDLVYGLWKKKMISKKKRQHKKPKYINDQHWTLLQEYWETDAAKKKSKEAAKSRKSDPVDGTFVDYRAEQLVTQAEMEATQLSNTEGSPGSPSASSAPSRLMLNKAYLKNAKNKRGHVYELGSAQYRENAPSSRVPNDLASNLELEMRVGGLETSLQSITADVAEVRHDMSDMRQDMAATRAAVDQLLRTLVAQQEPAGQNSAQPQFPTAQPNPLNGIWKLVVHLTISFVTRSFKH
ncbi:hypothetical protein Bca52824_011410 [Brassica carinata]|uniref:Uncharacterized protein n=1 Tax=Brassica carinata TaxID=52824 RepID=A0A8X7WG84_BRACI|nr:hypothetical protein Bca52824_011410 [Brassica carinata]